MDWLRKNEERFRGFHRTPSISVSSFYFIILDFKSPVLDGGLSWQQYCDKMEEDGVWGDHFTLIGASEVPPPSLSYSIIFLIFIFIVFLV